MVVGLRCLEHLAARWDSHGVVVLPYQVETAERLIEQMGGQGILADEVGLGKTIEAGLVASELGLREGCRSICVLCPSSLGAQWQREMAEKFGMDFVVDPEASRIGDLSRIIVSIDLAKRPRHRQALQWRTWDLVIVDEAHKLKNRATQNHRLVADLPRRHLLLLSATPLQNDLTELYALVSLVRPGLFGSFSSFWREFLLDRRTPKNPEALREVLASVMIRHHRQDPGLAGELELPPRRVSLLPLRLRPGERKLYDALTGELQKEYRSRSVWGEGTILPLILLQREVCSSAAAVAETLHAAAAGDTSLFGRSLPVLTELADAVAAEVQAKAAVVQGLISRLRQRVLVFTEFRATQRYLARNLQRQGVPVILFHGGQSGTERDGACRRFAAEPRGVMISTESGGQGLNLQFCHHLVNYDLPWNPMRIEQRIGRLHRIGQSGQVNIYNLFAEQTIEQHLLDLLDRKINLFRQVIGELDVILRRMERGQGRSLEGQIAEIIWSSGNEEELAFRFDELGRHFLRRRRLAEEVRGVLGACHSGVEIASVQDDVPPPVTRTAMVPQSVACAPLQRAVSFERRTTPKTTLRAVQEPIRRHGQRVQAVLPTSDWGKMHVKKGQPVSQVPWR